MNAFAARALRTTIILAFGVMVAAAGGAAAYFATTKSGGGAHTDVGKPEQEPPVKERVQRVGPDAVVVAPETCSKMGLRTALAVAPTRSVRLPAFQGVLALDNDRLSRVRSRFAGEVAEVGRSSASSPQPFRVGDAVQKGDLLAVVWSKDLGEKKSELVDTLSKLKLERDNLARYRSLTEGVIAAKQIREAEAAVRSSEVAVSKAEATLRAWRLGEEEIQAIIVNADKLGTPEARREWARDRTWAKVEVRAPLDGVILEKNVAVSDIVDTTADLFKVGDLSQLTVWVHVYEEDLAALQSLPRPVRWTVALSSQPSVTFPGTVDRVGSVIDPTQHTALVCGRVENPDGALRAGQFVTATPEAPPPAGEVELPALALVEDGVESLIFIQPDPGEQRFVRRSVQVLRRFRDVVSVKAEGGLRPGDRVVTAGAVLLRDAMAQKVVTAAK